MSAPHPNLSDAGDGKSVRLLLTSRQTAEALSISERTLWGLTDLPRVRIGRSVRYDVEDIRAWIASRKHAG